MREAASRGRRARRAAREVDRARHARADAGRRAAARRPGDLVGARDRRASSGSTWSPARSSNAREGEQLGANTSVHVGPDGELEGRLPQDPHVRRRDRRRPLRGVEHERARRRDRRVRAARRDQARAEHLLRPALPRAVPDPRAARGAECSPCRPRSRCRPRATTGRRWSARGRSRTSASWSRANQIGNHPGGLRSGGRSMIVDPWGLVLAGAPDTRDGDRRRARPRRAATSPAPAAGARRTAAPELYAYRLGTSA